MRDLTIDELKEIVKSASVEALKTLEDHEKRIDHPEQSVNVV